MSQFKITEQNPIKLRSEGNIIVQSLHKISMILMEPGQCLNIGNSGVICP